MKRIFVFIVVFLFAFAQSKNLFAQNDSVPKLKIAIFAPLYLDSAFDYASNYNYGKNFPKFINPGLEFYEGAQLALDSLKKEGMPLEVFVYDTRARNTSITQQLNSPELDDVGLIIAHTNAAEIRIFADAALKKKVPFINANLPNDGAVTANPYF
ncbi:MAG: amino acid ABC transporter substrate-binding protein, partial [Bacteroidota bacterium]|nr:amino acid ABC transporter substrate-binding protein [Bacteroidota bacterium]